MNNNMSQIPIKQVAVSTIKGTVKKTVYPKTTDKAVFTEDINGNKTTLDKVLLKGIKINDLLVLPRERNIGEFNIKTINGQSLLSSGNLDIDNVVIGKLQNGNFYKGIKTGDNWEYEESPVVPTTTEIYVDLLANYLYRWDNSFIALSIQDLSGLGDSIAFDSSTNKIYLKHGSTILSEIDASSFVVTGMIESVEVEDVLIEGETVTCLVITFNTGTGTESVNIPIGDIFDTSNYYTKSQIDSMGFLTEESDPVFSESPAGGITAQDISRWNSKQDALVSTENIKSINGQSILGEGNIGTSFYINFSKNGDTYSCTWSLGELLNAWRNNVTLFGVIADDNGSYYGNMYEITDDLKMRFMWLIPSEDSTSPYDINRHYILVLEVREVSSLGETLTEVVSKYYDTFVSPTDLSAVAFTGNYNDLSNKPTFKTINGKSIIGTGNIEISSGSSVYDGSNRDFSGMTLSECLDWLDYHKQNSLTFDTAPRANSTNPVTSGGIYNSLSSKISDFDIHPICGQNVLRDYVTTHYVENLIVANSTIVGSSEFSELSQMEDLGIVVDVQYRNEIYKQSYSNSTIKKWVCGSKRLTFTSENVWSFESDYTGYATKSYVQTRYNNLMDFMIVPMYDDGQWTVDPDYEGYDILCSRINDDLAASNMFVQLSYNGANWRLDFNRWDLSNNKIIFSADDKDRHLDFIINSDNTCELYDVERVEARIYNTIAAMNSDIGEISDESLVLAFNKGNSRFYVYNPQDGDWALISDSSSLGTYAMGTANVLGSMGSSIDGDAGYGFYVGDYYFRDGEIFYITNVGDVLAGVPRKDIVYCNSYNNKLYRWNGTQWIALT